MKDEVIYDRQCFDTKPHGAHRWIDTSNIYREKCFCKGVQKI